MARSRNIKPAFFDNDELADNDPLGRLLFIGLWTLADYQGNLEWRSKRIQKQILAYDKCDINKLAINLDKSGFIRFYSDGENLFVNILNFTKHQNPHKNERQKGSDILGYSDEARQLVDLKGLTINRDLSGLERGSSTSNPADSLILIPDSPILNPSYEDDHLLDEGFEIFYSAGLVKKSKSQAFKKFKSLAKQMKADPIESGQLLSTDVQTRIAKQQFGIDKLHPSTYLNNQRWTDEHEETNNGRIAPTGKQSAAERINARNAEKYGQPSGGLGMGESCGDLRGAMGEGERGNSITYVEPSSEQVGSIDCEEWGETDS